MDPESGSFPQTTHSVKQSHAIGSYGKTVGGKGFLLEWLMTKSDGFDLAGYLAMILRIQQPRMQQCRFLGYNNKKESIARFLGYNNNLTDTASNNPQLIRFAYCIFQSFSKPNQNGLFSNKKNDLTLPQKQHQVCPWKSHGLQDDSFPELPAQKKPIFKIFKGRWKTIVFLQGGC